MIATIALALTLFISTNIDDLFVILAFLADPKVRPHQVAVGQYLGLGVLVVVSVVASLISLVLPAAYIGLMGLVPIVIGLRGLVSPEEGEEGEEKIVKSGFGNVFSVAAVTIANGGDNIGVYIPVFATRPAGEISLIVLVFALMVAAWIYLAHALVNHPVIGAPIRRYGRIVAPFVLIAIGVMVVIEAGSVTLLWSARG